MHSHFESLGLVKDIDQAQILHVRIFVLRIAGNDKYVTAGQFPRLSPRPVQAFAATDNDDFGEFVGMSAKGLLRLPALHANRKAIGMKPITYF